LTTCATERPSHVTAFARLQKHNQHQKDTSQNKNAFEYICENQSYLPARKYNLI